MAEQDEATAWRRLRTAFRAGKPAAELELLERRGIPMAAIEAWLGPARIEAIERQVALLKHPQAAGRWSEALATAATLLPEGELGDVLARSIAADVDAARVKNGVTPIGERLVEAVRTPRAARRFVTGQEAYIFIDETWPDGSGQSEGIIAGVVCLDGYVGLPFLPTHSWQEGLLRTALDEVLARPDAILPFVLPLRVPTGENAQALYGELLEAALELLLGWILAPRPNGGTRLYIVVERQGGLATGDQRTEYFRGLLRGLEAVDPGRFAGWDVREVRWTHKHDGLVPYADALAYLGGGRNRETRALQRTLRLKRWPGYLPVSLDLMPTLLRLNQLERAHNVADALHAAELVFGTPLYDRIVGDVIARLERAPELRRRLLEEVNQRFDHVTSTAASLEMLRDLVKRLLPGVDASSPPRIRMLAATIEVQQANGAGDPVRGREPAERYRALRAEVLEPHLETALQGDLHLAVHECDSFEFARAFETLDSWTARREVEGLPLTLRGRLLSALGQTLSLLGQHADAESHYAMALDHFAEAEADEESRRFDLEQTGTYRAINALDAGRDDARAVVEQVLGPLADAVRALAGDDAPANRYRHALLVRTLWMTGAPEAADYVARRSEWASGPQHPWPLVEMYRALMLHSVGAPASALVPRIGAAATYVSALGATSRLVGSMVETVGACLGVAVDAAAVRQRLWDVAAAMPAMRENAEALTTVLDAPAPARVREALAACPFYFH